MVLEVQDVADYTGSPEILDGRVKTLHPKAPAKSCVGVGESKSMQVVELCT